MAIGRTLTNSLRGIWVWALIFGFLLLYGLRRLPTLLISDKNARRGAIAGLQGRTLRVAMSMLGACFVKLGQVMSSRPDLFEPELIEELRKLQDKLPPFAYAEVKKAVEAQLGKPALRPCLRLSQRNCYVASVNIGRLREGGVCSYYPLAVATGNRIIAHVTREAFDQAMRRVIAARRTGTVKLGKA